MKEMDYQYAIRGKRSVFMLIHPDCHLIGVSSAAQIFWEANVLIPGIYDVHFVSVVPSILTPQGLSISNIELISDIDVAKGDLIVIPGISLEGYKAQNKKAPEVLEVFRWLRENFNSGIEFCSIGSGTLLLADAQLLGGVQFTTHWKCYSYIDDHHKGLDLIKDKIYIRDKNLTSSAGMSSTLDTVISLIESHHGPIFASRLSQELLLNVRKLGDESQKSYYLDFYSHFNPLVHKAKEIIASNLSRNFSNEQIAEQIGTSERNLTRIFRATLGMTILEYKNKLRVKLVRHLVKNRHLSMTQIAEACGFSSDKQLKRLIAKNKESIYTRA